MKNELKYILLFFLIGIKISGQIKQFKLEKGHAQFFNGNLYIFGFSGNTSNALFCIYKLNNGLKVTDSASLALGKATADHYLQISSDTIHNYLNIYLQKTEKKLVTVLRFDKNFSLIANIENIDIARLNSISDFQNELFYFRNEVYTIKTQKDSSGVQFYLNKYTVKSETRNFEYTTTWQFPFERKNINSAHIFYVNKQSVFLFINIINGKKSGQWLLNIDANKGKLIRGTKLNDKEETNSYEFGGFAVDTALKSMLLVGQKFTDKQLRQDQNKLSISNAANALIYLTEMDSLGEITNRQDFKVPIADPKTTSKKIINNYIFRVSHLAKNKEGKISLEADIYKNTDYSLCYLYSNTCLYNIVPGDEGLIFEKNTLSSNPLVERFYGSNDKLDMNGKLIVDSVRHFEDLFYKSLTFPVKQLFKTDREGNFLWVLSKSNAQKNSVNFSYLSPVKKIYQLTVIEELTKENYPVFISLRRDLYVIPRQVDQKTYELRAYNW